MPRTIKKVFLSLLVFLVLMMGLVAPVRAANEWYSSDFPTWYLKVYGDNPQEIFGERYTAAQVQWVIYGFWSFIINGFIPGELTTCALSKDLGSCASALKTLLDSGIKLGDNNSSSPGMLAFFLEDRPLSAISYFRSVGRKFHIVPEVQAQAPTGFGFNTLGTETILNLWRASRNITYFLFVLVIIVMAFMIMFRVKISPQVVISVQSALPKIIIALILVTFSYAIAGLLVDLMYVVMGIISLFLANSNIGIPGGAVGTGLVFNMLATGPTLGPIHTGIFGFLSLYMIFFFITLLSIILVGGGIIVALLGSILTLGILPVVSYFVALIIYMVLAIIVVWSAFKIVWMLFKTFANIILLTIFAPFQIMAGTIVSGAGFGSWLRSFISNLAVFPVTGVMFMLAYIFLFQAFVFVWGNLLSDPWRQLLMVVPVAGAVASLPTGYWPPLLGTTRQMVALLYLGVSLAILMLIPKVADIIQAVIQGKPFAYGMAIGEATAPARRVGGFGGAAGVTEATRRLTGGEARFANQGGLTDAVRTIGGELAKWLTRI